MTLTDTGPLAAIINEDDPDHERCVAVLPELLVPMVTTWPVFTEALYLVGRDLGWRGQDRLWAFVEQGALMIETLPSSAASRLRELMTQYRDTPMDLADASLVYTAENADSTRIFTLDSHFYAYRLPNNRVFEVFPTRQLKT